MSRFAPKHCLLGHAVAALKTYAAVRVTILAVALVVHHLDPAYSLAGIPAAWDGGWYIRIAQHGYPHTVPQTFNAIAFLPLMPAAIWLAHTASGFLTWPAAASLVSLLAGAVFVTFATLLATETFGVRRGRQAGAILAAFPGLFVAGLGYPEPLALALVAAAFILIRRHSYAAGVAAGLAMVTTPVVLPLAGALAWELRRYRRRGVVALSVAVMGPLGWFLALWAWTGDPAAWLDAERPWGNALAAPWRGGTWSMLTTTIGAGGIFWMTLASAWRVTDSRS